MGDGDDFFHVYTSSFSTFKCIILYLPLCFHFNTSSYVITYSTIIIIIPPSTINKETYKEAQTYKDLFKQCLNKVNNITHIYMSKKQQIFTFEGLLLITWTLLILCCETTNQVLACLRDHVFAVLRSEANPTPISEVLLSCLFSSHSMIDITYPRWLKMTSSSTCMESSAPMPPRSSHSSTKLNKMRPLILSWFLFGCFVNDLNLFFMCNLGNGYE